MDTDLIKTVIIWSGWGHLALALGSLIIPRVLQWEKELASLNVLLRQMFWTYAGYILMLNVSFGVISVLGSDELLSGTFLARSITLLIGVYWLGRVAIQFFYFDRSKAPKGILFVLGEIMLVAMFLLFTVTYLAAFRMNLS